MSDITQDSLNLDVRYEISLEDFQGKGFQPIIEAINKITANGLGELFIVGAYGYGKTHLATAIYQHYTKNTQKTAITLSIGELIEQDAHAAMLAGLEIFDLIIIDDVQLVKNNYEWQEGLFHLINRARDYHKQMIFFADHPAHELQIGLLDLTTRLSLAPVLHMPDNDNSEDRSLLIRSILKHKNWRLPEEVFEHLLQEGPRNAGDISIVLNHIAPLLTHMTRTQVPKKTLNEIKNIIDKETFMLEFTDHSSDDFRTNINQLIQS